MIYFSFLSLGYGAYPPPPEPAPPDLPPPNRLRKAPSLPVSGHILGQKSFDDGMTLYFSINYSAIEIILLTHLIF